MVTRAHCPACDAGCCGIHVQTETAPPAPREPRDELREAGTLPHDLRLRREKLGEMLRDLEVIVSNYHSDGWRTRNESDAALFAEWQQIRGALFDALTDMTWEIEALRARLAHPGQDTEARCK